MATKRVSPQELEWLDSDFWVLLDDNSVREGYRPPECNWIVKGVEQSGIKRVYITDIYEIWHKPGRTVWQCQSQYGYEPSVFLVVWRTGQIIDGYRCFAVSKRVEPGRKYKAILRELIRDVERRYRGDHDS